MVFCWGSRWGRVEEQHLWSSGQIGEQTPSVLLRSLLYLNTKYFGLWTSEQHLRLTFGNVYGPSSSKPHSHETTVCIRIPSISQEQHGAFIWSIIHYSLVLLLFCNQFIMLLCIVRQFIFASNKNTEVRFFFSPHQNTFPYASTKYSKLYIDYPIKLIISSCSEVDQVHKNGNYNNNSISVYTNAWSHCLLYRSASACCNFLTCCFKCSSAF